MRHGVRVGSCRWTVTSTIGIPRYRRPVWAQRPWGSQHLHVKDRLTQRGRRQFKRCPLFGRSNRPHWFRRHGPPLNHVRHAFTFRQALQQAALGLSERRTRGRFPGLGDGCGRLLARYRSFRCLWCFLPHRLCRLFRHLDRPTPRCPGPRGITEQVGPEDRAGAPRIRAGRLSRRPVGRARFSGVFQVRPRCVVIRQFAVGSLLLLQYGRDERIDEIRDDRKADQILQPAASSFRAQPRLQHRQATS